MSRRVLLTAVSGLALLVPIPAGALAHSGASHAKGSKAHARKHRATPARGRSNR